MKFIAYLLQCLLVLLGAESENSYDVLIGFAILIVVLGAFAAVTIPLSWYTKLKNWQAILIGVVADVLFVSIFCILAVIIEKAMI